jgi:hypothetical protein
MAHASPLAAFGNSLHCAGFQEQLREETFDEKARAEADFFSYVATAYRHFLAGEDEECERVEAQQTAAFKERTEATRLRNQALLQVR